MSHDDQFDNEMSMLIRCRAHAQLEVSMIDCLDEMLVVQERHNELMNGDIDSDIDEIIHTLMHSLMYTLMDYFRSRSIVDR